MYLVSNINMRLPYSGRKVIISIAMSIVYELLLCIHTCCTYCTTSATVFYLKISLNEKVSLSIIYR